MLDPKRDRKITELASLMFALEGKSPSEAIPLQEARGQCDLIQDSGKLPVDGTAGHEAVWEHLGFKLGLVGKDIFRDATFHLAGSWK